MHRYTVIGDISEKFCGRRGRGLGLRECRSLVGSNRDGGVSAGIPGRGNYLGRRCELCIDSWRRSMQTGKRTWRLEGCEKMR